MSVINATPLIAAGDDGYQISRSVRLRLSAGGYFNRTPSVASNRRTFTWSGWVKRGILGTVSGTAMDMLGIRIDSNNQFRLYFNTSDQIDVYSQVSAAIGGRLITNAVYRDPSAWYHVVFAMDTTNATAGDRMRLYVNGVEVTSFSTDTQPSLNYETYIDTTNAHYMGYFSAAAFDGYLTEINFIDGQALTPSSFGETDAITGVWKPKKYGGTYGTNGFYLNFSDNSSNTAATIGKDYSGNGNNWTPNNISVTSGTTYDSMLDVPTPYADGGNGRGNYAVLNAVQDSGSLASGNLQFSGVAGGYSGRRSTIAIPSTGKWYWEINVTTQNTGAGNWFVVGMCINSIALTSFTGGTTGAIMYGDRNDGRNIYNETTLVTNNSTIDFSTGAVLQCAYDADTGKFWFGRDNSWWDSSAGTTGNPSTGSNQTLTAAAKEWFPYVQFNEANNVANYNFGQRPFTYTPPSGFKALNTQNLPTPAISYGSAYMAATLYTGTNANLTVTNTVNNVSMQPDFVWIKDRTNAYQGNLMDSVRGSHSVLLSSSTAAEATSTSTTGLLSFNSNGFSLGLDTSTSGATNTNTDAFVAWQWKAGAGTTSSNTSGSITSTVSVNATAGFSIVTYTGNTTAGATVGHGLGVAPSMIIFKNKTAGYNWGVYHASLGATKVIWLNLTDAAGTLSTPFNNTAPTSSVFSLGTASEENGSGGMVAYCFAEVAGYSKFGSYTGNGSTDGPFVYCGFRPRFIMFKKSSGIDNWEIIDTSRNTYNVNDKGLAPNTSAAEISNRGGDVLSNGFKLRFANGTTNESGYTYIYAAFAENPFKYSLAR